MRPKVLLVEDNLINVMVGKQILEKSKLNVVVANDGATAVEMVKNNLFDVILMDIQMPIMDGYTATTEIRKFNKKIPILATTNKSSHHVYRMQWQHQISALTPTFTGG